MIYSVIVDISNSQLDRVFDYKSDISFEEGQRVQVNFAGSVCEGFIIARKQTTDCPLDKLKDIIAPLDGFVAISKQMLSLADYMRERYHLRFADVLRLFIPSEMRKGRVKQLRANFVCLCADADEVLPQLKKGSDKQREVVEFLRVGEQKVSVVNEKFGASAVKTLEKHNFVKIYSKEIMRASVSALSGESEKHTLTVSQQKVADTVLSSTNGKFLLHGVTGSGKTEVYMHVIEEKVALGKNCLMLVPEISLTPNMLRLFRARFGDTVAILHSGLSAGERYDEWLRLKRGEAKIAIGARSAVFAPLENLGAIIIDEEHDSSYISDFNPRYNTIEVASFRASQNDDCVLLLGSATPSLESFYKAQKGDYTLLQLPERINKQPLPNVEIVNMRMELLKGNKSILSEELKNKLDETVKSGNQAILFINRRGYASFWMCTKCGYVAKCKDCDVTLTIHRDSNTLKCHYCNKTYRMLTNCPNCGAATFRQGKSGTQQVAELLKQLYPTVTVLRMDSDTTSTKEGYTKILQTFADLKAQILVGTQMVAKGHDFPNVTLVGILDGDQGLYSSNYLSSERTFQLLTQVAGRSGRDTRKGSVVLQTFTPDHYCLTLAAKQDYLSFYRKEINLRETAKFPPFSTIVRILYSGECEKDCIDQVTEHARKLDIVRSENPDAFYFLDKMRCSLTRAEGKFRFQILMKLDNAKVDETMKRVYAVCDVKSKKNVSVFVETNPQDIN